MNISKKKLNLAEILIIVLIVLTTGCPSLGFKESDQSISMNDLPAAVKSLADKETAGCKIR